MLIVVDDSGDPGVKLGKGSSEYFIIASVFFEDDLDAEEVALKIKRLRQKLKWQPKHEFKFRKTSPEIRKAFLSEIRNCNFEISLVVLNKNDIVSNKEYRSDSSRLYNQVILKSVQVFQERLKSAYIHIDGESGIAYRRNVKTYFRKNLPKNAMKDLRHKDSKSDNLIQLADMIVGAARRSIERDKDASYLKIIKKRIVKLETSL